MEVEMSYWTSNNGCFTKVLYKDIYYVEACGNHTRFICKDPILPFRMLINDENISTVLSRIDPMKFLKCHRCYIVNTFLVNKCKKEGRGGIIYFDNVTESQNGVPHIYFSEKYKRILIERLRK